MLHYLYGEDTFGARLRVTEIVGDTEVRWVDKQAIADFPVYQWLDQASGSLFGAIIVVARDPSGYLQAYQEDLVTTIDALHAAAAPIILWDRTSPDKRSKLFRGLKPYGQEFPGFAADQVRQWVGAEVQRRGMRMDAQVIAMLVSAVGVDRWRLSSELDRLELLGISVTMEHIIEHVAATEVDAQIFTLLDALVAGDQQKTMRMLEDFWVSGESEFYILSMLAYQFKTVLAIRQGIDSGMQPDAVARSAQLNPYVVKKTWNIAQKISVVECLQVLSRVLATDFAIKQGKVDARTATIMLTLTLVRERSASATAVRS